MGLVTPDFGLVFWMTVSFLIVLFILRKFAWTPILTALHEREKSITDALSSAEKAKEDIAQMHADNQKIIQEAKEERDRLLKEAREVKDTIINDAKDAASQEGKKLIEAAKKAIDNEKAAALNEIKMSIATLSVDIAEKILKQNLSGDKDQQKLVDNYLKDIKLN